MTNELLVIIDPQNDFINKEGSYAKRHAGIKQILNAKEKINKLIAVHDKNNLVIVFSNYEEDQFEKGVTICIPGTDGHKIDIDVDDSYTLILKKDHSCFSSDDFNQHLKNKKIHRLILCGFLAEYCVKKTALDALDNGYSISLLKDCIGTGDDVQHLKEQMLLELMAKGATIIDSDL